MQRRSFVGGVLLFGVASTPVRAQEKQITVIYVGGWDCGPCIRWKNNAKSDFVKSPQYAKVNYVEIESPRLSEAYRDQYWPEKLRPIREQLPRKGGTPRFLVVKDGVVVSNGFGNASWPDAVKKIQELVASS